MPKNWDPNQNLNGSRVEWPTGPLTFDRNTEEPTWVEAWVMQDATGASQRTGQSKGWVKGHWTADENPWKQGAFQSGPALGIPLAAWKDTADGTSHSEWWVRIVNLS